MNLQPLVMKSVKSTKRIISARKKTSQPLCLEKKRPGNHKLILNSTEKSSRASAKK